MQGVEITIGMPPLRSPMTTTNRRRGTSRASR